LLYVKKQKEILMIRLASIALISIFGIATVLMAIPKQDLSPSYAAETQRFLAIKKTLETETPKLERKYKKNEQLSPQELKDILYQVGFRGERLREAWGTAMKESTGRPRSHNDNPDTGDNSYGLFQINMIDSLGPARLKQFNLKSNKDLFNPVRNAEIAFFMSDGGKNWSSWNGITESTKKWMKEFPG
jgi:hypothetical protein